MISTCALNARQGIFLKMDKKKANGPGREKLGTLGVFYDIS